MSDDMRVPFSGDRRSIDERRAAAAVAELSRLHRTGDELRKQQHDREAIAKMTSAEAFGQHHMGDGMTPIVPGPGGGMRYPTEDDPTFSGLTIDQMLAAITKAEASGDAQRVAWAAEARSRYAAALFAASRSRPAELLKGARGPGQMAEGAAAVENFRRRVLEQAAAAVQSVAAVAIKKSGSASAVQSQARAAVTAIQNLVEQVSAIKNAPEAESFGPQLQQVIEALDNALTPLSRMVVAPPTGDEAADLTPAPADAAGTSAAPVAKSRPVTVVSQHGDVRVLSDGTVQTRRRSRSTPIAKSQPPADTVQFRPLFER